MVVKIPMTVEGLKAVKVLSSEGIKTNVTLIFSANQAILAANAGATYVSPFLGRLDDISQPGIELIRQISEILISMDMTQRLLQLQSETRFMSQTVHLQELISQQFLTRLLSR